MSDWEWIIFSCTIILLSFGLFYRYQKIGNIVPNPVFRKHSSRPISLIILWILRASIIGCVLLFMRNIHINIKEAQISGKSNSIMIAMDVSQSMRADDVFPSRLEQAKEVISDFIRNNSNDALGLVIFSGRSFILSRPTKDKTGLLSQLQRIDTEIIDQSKKGSSGTNIGDAIIASLIALSGSTQSGSIILVTDGRVNTGVDPLLAGGLAKNLSIPIYTIGIGTSSGEVLGYNDEFGNRQFFYNPDGTRLTADIDEKTLRTLSEMTRGEFFRADNSERLNGIFRNIAQYVESQTSKRILEKTLPINPYLFAFMLVLIGLHVIIWNRFYQKYKLT